MSNSEIIQIVLSISTFFVSVIAIWISNSENRRKNLINKAISYSNDFVNIYTYLYKVQRNIYDDKWINENQILYFLHNQNILKNSIIHIFPNIQNNNYYESLKHNEQLIFIDIINKSFINLENTLKTCSKRKIRKNKNFWKLYSKKIQKIQKYLINKLNLIRLKIHNNKNILEFQKENKYQEFWIEFITDPYEIKNQIFKSKNNIKLKFFLWLKTKILGKENIINKNWKIIFILNYLNPKINKLFIKSNIYILNFYDKNNKYIQQMFSKNKEIINKESK